MAQQIEFWKRRAVKDGDWIRKILCEYWRTSKFENRDSHICIRMIIIPPERPKHYDTHHINRTTCVLNPFSVAWCLLRRLLP